MLYRSEKVNYYDLVMPYASAWTVMNTLGNLNSIQLIDLNKTENALNKTFNVYLKRCDDLLGKI
jgi:V-type H+-transporting ATPase subunit a